MIGATVSHYRVLEKLGDGGTGVVYRAEEAMEALTKAWKSGFRDSDWARRDPDLGLLHGDPEFEKLYPETGGGTWGSAD